MRGRYGRALDRFGYGSGVFKIDWALSQPIPWTAPGVNEAATVHVGGTLEEIARSEAGLLSGQHSDRPYVLLAQQSLFDPTRAPAGKHTAWAYCHVPHGSTRDMTQAIEDQIERFAPGFRDCIASRSTMDSNAMEAHDSNLVGGDIGAGLQNLKRLLFGTHLTLRPHRTSDPRLFLGSASTPPGPGVHGMCGYHAARAALRSVLR